MKKFSKILSVALLVALVLSLGVANAFAADGDQTIVIKKAVEGETYKAYKLMDATYDGNNLTASTPITYYYAGTADDALFVILDKYFDFQDFQDGKAYLKVVDVDGKAIDYSKVNVAGLAAEINAAVAAGTLTLTQAGETATAVKNGDTVTATITVPEKGYYFVDTSLGSICSIDTAGNNVQIEEKNSTTTTDKTVEEDSTEAYGDKNDADIGQVVNFKTTVKIGKGQSNVILHDVMQPSLAIDYSSIAVSNNAADHYTILTPASDTTHSNFPASDAANYKADYATDTFAIVFDTAWTESLTAAVTEVEVTYSATLTAEAIVGDQSGVDLGSGNDNKTKVDYGNDQHTEWDYTRTYTWELDIFKYTGTDTPLAGAEFQLLKGATALKFDVVFDGKAVADDPNTTEDETKAAGTAVYRYNANGTVDTLVTPANGKIQILGLDADTYSLVETKAPDGYNKLLAPITVVIDSNTDSAQGTDGTHQADGSATVTNTQGETTGTGMINVQNNSGTVLPSTGGIGTTIFYVVGGVLVLAAIILLVTKKRMSE